MSFKWNENSTLIFLNAYQKHPCLWNPHHVKFYDCLAKNEALKNIIKELNIPRLNISDCLEQIKVIREKYGQEQVRVIEGFHLQKPYKSSFIWFPIISEMLTKVINDESKLQNKMRSTGTISPSILKDCVTTPYKKYKNIFNFPCLQETRQDYKAKPRKNTKFTTAGKSDISNDKNKGKNDTQLLQCPSCGWEDFKPDKLNIITKKTYELVKPLDTVVPCPEYTNLADKPYEGYKTYGHQVDPTYQERHNTVPCPSFSRNLPNCTGYPTNISNCSQNTRDYINQQREAIVTSKPKFCTRETHLLSEQLFPEKQTKQIGTNIEHRDKGVQNTICVSRINDTLPSFKSSHVEVNSVIRKCHRKVQSRPLILQEDLKQVEVNTMERCDKEIQNTICMSCVNLSDCQNFEKYSSMIQQSKQVDNVVECSAKNMQNLIGIKLKTLECSMPNIVLVTIDGNCVPLIQTNFKLKQLATDNCQKDTDDLCQDQKEAEKAYFAFHGKKFVENDICTKETCSPDVMEIIKHNSAITQALLQCLEKIAPLQEKTKTHSITSLLSKKDDVNSNSSETTICEPCKFANESKPFATSSAIELENPNCLPCLEKTEEDNVVTMSINILELMKHALVLNNKKCAENVQKGCLRKEDAIDTFIFLNKVKECADKVLRMYTVVDCSKKQLSNKFCPRYKSKDKCPPKTDLTLSEIQTQVSENGTNSFTVSNANSKDIEVLRGLSMPKIRDPNLSENYATFIETATEKKPSVKDKEITSRSENHDISLNVSLSQISLRDSGTQYSPKQLQDTGVVTEHEQSSEEKINVSTQNREPILIRVIKCNNSEGILKLDKETCVRDAHVAWMRNVDKCIETYPVLFPRLSKNTYRKYLIKKCYNQLLQPDIPYVREKEVNCIDYRASLLSNKNYRYDKRYKSSLSCNQNWIKVNIPTSGLLSNQHVSRIPLYTGSHKYTRRRTDLYKMSQLYTCKSNTFNSPFMT